MRVLIVDKEPPDRSALANVVATRKDVEVCASAENATDALDKLQKEEYDILLLDGPMSEMSEIELVGRLKKRHRLMPAVIFVTARRHHAITAGEKHSVDYVLKPFSSERIHEALNTAIRRKANERAARSVQRAECSRRESFEDRNRDRRKSSSHQILQKLSP